MKKVILNVLGIFGMLIMFTTEISAKSFLSKVSSAVLIFSILGGVGIWVYALWKKKQAQG